MKRLGGFTMKNGFDWIAGGARVANSINGRLLGKRILAPECRIFLGGHFGLAARKNVIPKKSWMARILPASRSEFSGSSSPRRV
jgi:hypothetical protein